MNYCVNVYMRNYISRISLFLTYQIMKWLESHSLQCLKPSEKVQVLCFLVEELLDSVALTREVDTRMEQIASLRRDKWKISLKMKRYVFDY